MKNLDQKVKGQLLLLISMFWIISCQPGINVQSSYDRSTDFDEYNTFAWYPAEAASNLRTGYDPEIDRRVKTAVEAELIKKGMLPDAESPNILIAYDIALGNDHQAPDTVSPAFGYGYSYWYGYRFNYDVSSIPDYKTISQYPKGTLVIDLVNPKTNKLVWRGVTQAEIELDHTDESAIRGAINKIFLQYPPK